MLSKCLNSHCSATFQYFGQGRLFRIDFSEPGRKSALAGKAISITAGRSNTYPIEHFWLCESCATCMTVELNEEGEVRLVTNEKSTADNAQRIQNREAAAS